MGDQQPIWIPESDPAVVNMIVPAPLASDLTVDSLLAAIRYFLEAEAANPISEHKVLTLQGYPGDQVIKDVLWTHGGEITIKIKELPRISSLAEVMRGPGVPDNKAMYAELCERQRRRISGEPEGG